MEEKYAVTFLFDDKFVDYAMVSLVSFLRNNKWFNGDVIVICEGDKLSKESREKVRKIHKQVIFHEVDKGVYQEYFDFLNGKIGDDSFPLEMLYKLEIFTFKEYDKVLYLDSDILVIDDIRAFFENDHDMILTSDGLTSYYRKQIEEDNTTTWFSFCDTYCNCGVFCVGKKYLKERDSMLSFMKTKVNFTLEGNFLNMKYFMEQDLINLYFNNREKCIIYPPIYNLQIRNMGEDNLKYYVKAKILHYICDSKPKYYPSLDSKSRLFLCSPWFTYENLTKEILKSKEVL